VTSAPGPETLAGVREMWDLPHEPFLLRRVENFVYSCSDVIVRITESAHRSSSELEAELDWVDYLARRGLTVARPLPSRHGRLVERLADYGVCVFRRAPGKPPREAADFAPHRLRLWGAYIGRMHRLTRDYRPSPGITPRRAWNLDEALAVARRGLNPRDEPAYSQFTALVAWLQGLPRTSDCYGLVHADMHQGNFHLDGDTLTAFDFDDCCHHWFAYDLATPIFTLLDFSADHNLGLTFDTVMPAFLEGYATEHVMDASWIGRLPAFLRFRALDLYHWTQAKLPDFDAAGHAWAQRTLPRIRAELARPVDLV
jgi:amicoumacin kinase